jgi:phospholipid transport system substrate-binding protein
VSFLPSVTREFKAQLSRTYGRNIDNYKNERVEILSDRAEGRGDWTVRTRVRRDSDTILVDYRLRATDGTWRIIDIIVEGVSLVANFRSQFQEIVAQDGPEQLLKMLRDKNLLSEPIAG